MFPGGQPFDSLPKNGRAMNKVIFGDCREVMRGLIADGVKVQACVTSPPYWGLRDYGVEGQLGLETTPEEYIQNMVEVFSLVREILTDDGTLWLNMGDSYSTGKTGRDDTGIPGNGSKLGHKKDGNPNGTAIGGACKPRKCPPGIKPKDLVGIPWMLALALRDAGAADLKEVQTLERVWLEIISAYPETSVPDRVLAVLERLDEEYRQAKGDSWYLRQDIIWAKPNPMPESCTDRCTKAHEYLFLLTKQPRYYYDNDAVREPVTESTTQRMSQDVENQQGSDRVPGKTNGPMKAVKRSGNKERKPPSERGVPADGHGNMAGVVPWEGDTRNKRSVWTVATKGYKDAHFATFPPKLIEPCILAGSKPGQIVFDPFMGSGTTAMVAEQLGRRWLGIELNPEYEPLQRARTAQQGLGI